MRRRALEHDLAAVVTSVSESIGQVIRHATVGLALYEPGTRVLCSSVLSSGGQPATLPPAVVLNESSPCAIALAAGAATVFGPNHLGAFEPEIGLSLLTAGARALCCVPLVTARGVLGTLNLAKDDAETFDPQDVALLASAAEIIE